MILSFVMLVLAALVGLVLLPLIAVLTGFPFFLLAAGYLIAAWVLLCWVGHAQNVLGDAFRTWRQHHHH